MTLDEKLNLAEEKIKRADDYREIFNLISLQTMYIRVQKQKDAFENCWSKREDISYGAAKGRQDAIDFFLNESARAREYKQIIAHKYHGVEITPENNGIGDLDSIGAASPYIIIAGDRKTAQGVWFTPEVKSELGNDGQLRARYIQQKIGVDLINEDDETTGEARWKIWHYNIYPDFTCELSNEIFDDSRYTGRTFDVEDGPKGPGGPEPGEGMDHGRDGGRMAPYSPTKVPYFNPPIPTPYETWNEDETLPMG